LQWASVAAGRLWTEAAREAGCSEDEAVFAVALKKIVKAKMSNESKSDAASRKSTETDMYLDYIACLNKQDWPKLGQFVDDEVIHNGRRVGLSGYREMLERDFHEIPDLFYFNVQMLISDPPYIATRIHFERTPKGNFLGLHVNGKRVSFAENVIYELRSERIVQVWSVIDKAAIEAQV